MKSIFSRRHNWSWAVVFSWFLLSQPVPGESIARVWNEQNLDAIRIDFPNPPVHARNLFHLSVAMWDAWAAYDSGAIGYIHREDATAADIESARREAISYAGYRILEHRYALSVNAATSLQAFDDEMAGLGYNTGIETVVGEAPAAVGNRVAAAILEFAESDLSNEASNYVDWSYFPVNNPLIVLNPGTIMLDPNRWQPLAFDERRTQNGLVAQNVQTFVGSHWGAVRPFAMALAEGESIYYDPGLPPQLGGVEDALFKSGNITVIERSRDLDPDSGVMVNLSPRVSGNHTLGQNDGTGHGANPVTGQPYADNIVPLGDYGRVLAEFWADGPDSETPPGHWNVVANEVSDHPEFQRRVGGVGPVLDELEWDVKLYFALNAATHDVAVAVWGCKELYDYVRPISSIRYLASKGQSSDAGGPRYHAEGIPLEPGLIEVVSAESAAVGERHEGFVEGEIVLFAWGGEPAQPLTEYTGAKWISASTWFPYQRDTFVTPAFAGYVSGHSAFSRAAAEVLTSITGNPYFPEGLGTFTAEQNAFLKFEIGPSVDVELQWATYYDAADEAGISRLYGGIHVPVDDGPGRIIGSKCGLAAWALASRYFDATIIAKEHNITAVHLSDGRYKVFCDATRGMFYRLESSIDLLNYTPVGPEVRAGYAQFESLIDVSTIETGKFFRITRLTTPEAD
ncbi:MAG: vanadium-dependent haloperoxidase [Verrucomicrobiales bacterium]|nr:vanadium-dependent haloperoxidase [Verrucomicrobiales bacterium]